MTPTRAEILALIHDPQDTHFHAAVMALRQGAAGEKRGIEVLTLLRWHERNRRQDDHSGKMSKLSEPR